MAMNVRMSPLIPGPTYNVTSSHTIGVVKKNDSQPALLDVSLSNESASYNHFQKTKERSTGRYALFDALRSFLASSNS